jgi:hypothetical protein
MITAAAAAVPATELLLSLTQFHEFFEQKRKYIFLETMKP